MTNKVVLSTTLLVEEGVFEMKALTIEEAAAWVRVNAPANFCGHQTVKVVGLQPSESRAQCSGFDQALCLKPLGRLEFGKEYSLPEILEIGVQPLLITKLS